MKNRFVAVLFAVAVMFTICTVTACAKDIPHIDDASIKGDIILFPAEAQVALAAEYDFDLEYATARYVWVADYPNKTVIVYTNAPASSSEVVCRLYRLEDGLIYSTQGWSRSIVYDINDCDTLMFQNVANMLERFKDTMTRVMYFPLTAFIIYVAFAVAGVSLFVAGVKTMK